ncbi:MAG: hypothetical protein JWO38_3181 [Gemmataceae bacterium]|nr:hypothetical protein [Gemmataceae bacterium]
MQTTTELKILDRLLDPIRDCLTVEVAARLVGLRADEATQSLLDQLAEKNAEGTITPDERAEYESLVTAGNLIAVLQAKARSVLGGR